MATLKTIIQEVADNIGLPYDNAMKKRIQALLITGRGKYIKQQISNYGVSGNYVGTTTVDMKKVKLIETCDDVDSCYILRSVNKIPRPVMYRSSEPFVNVSTADGVRVAIKTTRTVNKNLKFLRYIHSVMTYDYRNGYLYMYNNTRIRKVLIDFIPKDLKYVDNDADCDADCYQADYEFMLDDDLIIAIKTDIYKELGMNVSKDADVPVSDSPVKER